MVKTEPANDTKATEEQTETASTTSSDFEPKRAKSKVEYESRRAKFRTVANRRVKNAIKAIRILAQLGGRNAIHYDYAQADVDLIVTTLQAELDELGKVMYSPNGGHQLDIEFDVEAKAD